MDLVGIVWFFVNEYRVGICCGGSDLGLGCGESCGKVGKEWGFARGGVVENFVGNLGGLEG